MNVEQLLPLAFQIITATVPDLVIYSTTTGTAAAYKPPFTSLDNPALT